MDAWPVGLSTGCFYKRNIRDNIDAIIAAEFHLLEVSSSASHFDIHDIDEVRSIRRYLDKYNVEIFSLHGPFSKHIDITSPDTNERTYAHREILQALEAAVALRVRCLVLHPWPEKEHLVRLPESKDRKRYGEQFIKELSLRCGSHGITLALENMQPQLLLSPLRDLMWLRKETEDADVGVCFDTGHALLTGNLHGALHDLAGHISLAHVHDNWGKYDDHLFPGNGIIDWPRFLADLLQTGFCGPLILEIDDRDGVLPETVLHAAQNTRDFLRKTIHEIRMVKHKSI